MTATVTWEPVAEIAGADIGPARLAPILGVDRRTIYRWIAVNAIPARYAPKIADALHVDIEHLWPTDSTRKPRNTHTVVYGADADGRGRALCECGDRSPLYHTGADRQTWHHHHRLDQAAIADIGSNTVYCPDCIQPLDQTGDRTYRCDHCDSRWTDTRPRWGDPT